jgi:hypothetical protein
LASCGGGDPFDQGGNIPIGTNIDSAAVVINAPVKGIAPSTTASGTGNFTASAVSWSPNNNPFLGGTVYTAAVTLTANSGYTFSGLNSATINRQNAAESNNTGTNVTLSYTFPATNTKIVTNMTITSQPTKMTYTHDDPLDLSGLTVRLTYDDTTTEDVAASNFAVKNITANPAHGNILDHLTHNGQSVKITYGGLTRDTSVLSVSVPTFTTIAAFKTWLDAQPANTAATAYNVKVNIANLGGNNNTAGSLGNALYTNRSPAKYVNLDLSGSTITGIGDYAFYECTSLTSVTIGNRVTTIEDVAFLGCTSLTGITIPNSVTSIGEGDFGYCVSLTSVTIGSGVTSIGLTAFQFCISLTSVTFTTGSNIANTNFGDNAFPEGSNGFGGNTLRTAYNTGRAGTYTRAANGSTWTKSS